MIAKYPANDEMFSFVRMLNLPFGEYAITSSGPLGVRELREIGDIDLVVSDKLWSELATHYGEIHEDGVSRIKIGEFVEVLGEGSYYNPTAKEHSAIEQIQSAEVIGGLPFVRLDHILYVKQKMNRPKDQPDIQAIKTILGLY